VLDEGFDPPFEIVGQVVVFEQNAIFGEHYPLRYGRREDLLGRTSTTNMSALAILRLSLSGYDFRRLDWSVLREPELIYR
jgi:hypothetical protein